MKPIVVSAAAAVRTPSAEPRVSAARPCSRRRREMLEKSIDYSPWRVTPLPTLSNSWPSPGGAASPLCRKLRARTLGEISRCSDLEKRVRGFRAGFALIKISADFANCMQERWADEVGFAGLSDAAFEQPDEIVGDDPNLG